VDLSNEAFTPRENDGIAVLQQLTTLAHRSRYKTRPLHNALRTALGSEILFGGQHESGSSYTTKVAVTSTSHTTDGALVIANYNRQEDTEPLYKLEFADEPSESLSVWEAAAATSAAPSFFKPFYCEKNQRIYLDGALYHNNPVKVANHERQLLWPDVAKKHPDVFLSIGTSQNARKIRTELGKINNDAPKLNKRKNFAKLRKDSRASSSLGLFFSVLVSLP
jgi:Patatin-like phospholipase